MHVLCKEHCSAECPCLSLSCVACSQFCLSAKAAWRLFIHDDNPQILWMPQMDAQRVQNSCLDTVAQSYISLRSHKAAAHKRTSCFLFAAIIDVFFEFYALVYQLNKLKLMTVNLYCYGSDLWSNKNDIRHGQNQRFLVRTAEWECSIADTSREQRAFCKTLCSFLLLFSFPHLFFLYGSAALSDVVIPDGLVLCGEQTRRILHWKYKNMSACGHDYGSLDHLSAPKITSRPHGEK